MAYTLGITVLNIPGIALSSFSGSLSVPANASPVSATSTNSLSSISFNVPWSPPPKPGILLLTDPAVPGDIFRSGPVINWPREPAFINVYVVPMTPVPALPPSFLGVGRFSYTQLASMLAKEFPIVLKIPGWLGMICGLLTAFKFFPDSFVITSISFMQSTTGPGIIRAVFGGAIDYTTWGAQGSAANFTGSIDLKPTPSGDASDPANVIRITALNLSLNIDFLSAPIIAIFAGLFASQFSDNLSEPLSDQINGAIASAVGSTLPGIAPGLTSTATISARSITVAASGIGIQTVASDLPRPRWLTAAVAPQPQVTATPVNYTVTVEDTSTGAAIAGATVTLHNFTTAGAGANISAMTDLQGQATFEVALHTKRTVVISRDGTNRDGKPEREPERVSESPTLTVTAAGYNDLNRPLF